LVSWNGKGALILAVGAGLLIMDIIYVAYSLPAMRGGGPIGNLVGYVCLGLMGFCFIVIGLLTVRGPTLPSLK
jgi:amino acid permease